MSSDAVDGQPPRITSELLSGIVSNAYTQLSPQSIAPNPPDVEAAVFLLFNGVRSYPSDYSGYEFGASVALAFVDLARKGMNIVADGDADHDGEVSETRLWHTAFTVAVVVAGFEVDREITLLSGHRALATAADILKSVSDQRMWPETAKHRLAAQIQVLDSDSRVEPAKEAGSPHGVARFTEWVSGVLDSTAGTFIRLAVGIAAVVAVAGFLFLWWRSPSVNSTDVPSRTERQEDSAPLLPDLAGQSDFQVTSWAYRTQRSDDVKTVSGQAPGQPLVVGPGERLFVDVTLEKRDSSVPLPSNLGYAVSTTDDTPIVTGSFRLFNDENRDGVAIPDMTSSEYSPISFNRGGTGISMSFSVTAPTDVFCGYNERRILSYFRAGSEKQMAASTIYVARNC